MAKKKHFNNFANHLSSIALWRSLLVHHHWLPVPHLVQWLLTWALIGLIELWVFWFDKGVLPCFNYVLNVFQGKIAHFIVFPVCLRKFRFLFFPHVLYAICEVRPFVSHLILLVSIGFQDLFLVLDSGSLGSSCFLAVLADMVSLFIS